MSGSIIPANPHNWGTGLGPDIWNQITNCFINGSVEGDVRDFIALACACKDLSLWIPAFVSRLSPKTAAQFFGSRLQVINLCCDIHSTHSPLIAVGNLFELFIGYHTIRRLAGDTGSVGLLIQQQGFNFKELQETAANKEFPVTVVFDKKINLRGTQSFLKVQETVNSISIEKLKVSLIAFPPASINKDYQEWLNFAKEQGCPVPDVLDCITFCTLGEQNNDVHYNAVKAAENDRNLIEWRSSSGLGRKPLAAIRDCENSSSVDLSLRDSYNGIGTAIGRELTAAKVDSSWQTFLSDYPIDIGEKVLRLLKARDIVSIACVNSSCHQWVPECASIIALLTLQEMLGPTFRVINMIDELTPFDFDRFGMIRAWEAAVPRIAGKERAGMTLMALPEGLTFRKFVVEIAPKTGVAFLYYPEDFELYADIALETQQVIVITNGTFTKDAAKKAGCEVPGVLAYAVHCALTYEKYKICLYKGNRDDPRMITSTIVDGESLGVCVRDGDEALFPIKFYAGNSSEHDITAGFRRV
jgi:hypothetical protein